VMVSIAGAIGAGLFFAFVQSLGLTLQRKSHLENADLRLRDWQRPTWVIGFLIFIVSNTLGSVVGLLTLLRWSLRALEVPTRRITYRCSGPVRRRIGP
jgi:hypothetical protein